VNREVTIMNILIKWLTVIFVKYKSNDTLTLIFTIKSL
jgi:hypothetical protein